MFKLLVILSSSFIVFSANAGFKIEGSYNVAGPDFCNQYEVMKSALETAKTTYDLVFKLYSKQIEGSEKQKEYKIRLDEALNIVNSMQENVNFYKRHEFAGYKVLLDSNYAIAKSDLVNDEGYVDISYSLDNGDYISVFTGTVMVKFYGANLCDSSESTNVVAEQFLEKIFN